MKELEAHNKVSEKIEITRQRQQEIKFLHQGVIVPRPGQKLFQVNKATSEVSEPVYKTSEIDFVRAASGDMSISKELVIIEGCVYIPALNKENAFRKFLKNPDQYFYFKKPAAMSINPYA